jgi:hypothetical protein
VKPVTQIRSDDTVEFSLDIVYSLGVSNCIIIDKGI